MSLPEQCSMEMSVQSVQPPPPLPPSLLCCLCDKPSRGLCSCVGLAHGRVRGHTHKHVDTLTNTALSLRKYGIFALNKL